MRQGQQNRRGRGRNRKSQNPLTRSFESAGPDVKLRGTPSHIAEKYMSLARDALSSGDPVLAENYMQHAEHYNRIIMSFREQQISQGGGEPFAGGTIARGPGMPGDPLDDDEFGDGEGDDFAAGPGNGQPDLGALPQPAPMPQQQRHFDAPQRYDNRPQHHRRDRDQQRHNNQRHDRDGNRYDRHDRGDRQFDRQDRGDRGDRDGNRHDRGDRQDRQDFRGDRGERGERPFDRQPDRNFGDRNGGDRNGPERGFAPERNAEPRPLPVREERPAAVSQPPLPPLQEASVTADVPHTPAPRPRRERFQPAPEQPGVGGAVQHQPEFLRRPVRRTRQAEPAAEEAPAPAPRTAEGGEE